MINGRWKPTCLIIFRNSGVRRHAYVTTVFVLQLVTVHTLNLREYRKLCHSNKLVLDLSCYLPSCQKRAIPVPGL
jgi:hypothetical protein